jgi:dTDP-4-dehydrorhamnose 3,5-epimerase-like enzyme
MSLIKILNFPPLGDSRGSLVAIEEFKNIPFSIERVYYIFNTKKGVSRGFHSHKKLQQLAVCVTGKCRMVLDNGKKREEVWLDSPTKGLLIGNNTWREMHDFSSDCVLVVLASEPFNESDYIRSYEDFKEMVTG